MLAILISRQDETCVSAFQGMAVQVPAIEVIKGVQGCDAIVHGLDVFRSVSEGFSAEEADLFFGGELVGHWGVSGGGGVCRGRDGGC